MWQQWFVSVRTVLGQTKKMISILMLLLDQKNNLSYMYVCICMYVCVFLFKSICAICKNEFAKRIRLIVNTSIEKHRLTLSCALLLDCEL